MGVALMELVLRATAMYWFLWAVMRGVGKRELAELSPFDFILLVTIGDLVQQGVTQEDFSVTGAVVVVSTVALWVSISSIAQNRSKRLAVLLSGVPAVVVRDGEAIMEVLELQRLSIDDVAEAAREQGIGDLAEVRVAVLEPDGRFSFITEKGEQHDSPEPPVM